MKKQVTTLITLTLLASLAACSKPASNSITKGDDAVDAFQQKSIAKVGLVKKLALTFDDGPSAAHTMRLLDILEKENVKASFFLNGKNVKGNEAIVSMVSLGFGVGVLPKIVVDNSPLAERVEPFMIQPDLGPYSMGICVMEKRLKSPILNAFWAQLIHEK